MIHIEKPWFKDEQGRILILRGVNLGGSTKVPTQPNGATHLKEGFFNHRDVSFVGRPFPLEEADEHFARLKAWGMTFLRFLVTWEAIEHAGPGLYDEAYLDYVRAILEKANEYGIQVFIDSHQDVWSRFSGGDGAPGWTFDIIGMDIERFQETGAAFVHQVHGDPYPRMIWLSNHGKLATATMYTLFFGGNDFAPQTKVEGEPVQEYLQRHYIEALKTLVRRLKGLPNVMGYNTMNEPNVGFIGFSDMHQPANDLRQGDTPTIYQTMLLGAGIPQEVGVWEVQTTGNRQTGKRWVNEKGISVWKEGYTPLWQHNGVWELDTKGHPQLLRPHHFSWAGNRYVNFYRDYFRPFANRYAQEIRSVEPGTMIFVETIPESLNPLVWRGQDAPNIVHSRNWYDITTLLLQNYIPALAIDYRDQRLIIGKQKIRKTFSQQIQEIKSHSRQMNNAPTHIGEFGIPFNMKDKEAYETGDFSVQVKALDASYRAIESNMVNSTLWNYTADNTNERGDQWNGEDLSLFSRDQQDTPDDINSGGRALQAAVRPYARAVAGEPLRMTFDIKKRAFAFEFRHDPTLRDPTEFFIPNLQYPEGYVIEVSDGYYTMNIEEQTLLYYHSFKRDTHLVRVWDMGKGSPEAQTAKVQRTWWASISSSVTAIAAGLVIWWLLSRRKKRKQLSEE
ncbi:MAG: cellulase family glycosylhydrolase [Anaerolineae bacterium]|nr:cellulase family glycosylhydrolase [Anaerolineae bacterium]